MWLADMMHPVGFLISWEILIFAIEFQVYHSWAGWCLLLGHSDALSSRSQRAASFGVSSLPTNRSPSLMHLVCPMRGGNCGFYSLLPVIDSSATVCFAAGPAIAATQVSSVVGKRRSAVCRGGPRVHDWLF
ncbi:hypothetical protein B0J18DRAFT_441905 [Chaetomium sp. MPI-SDFR-AT-0129]|nr:hypothetical protein B0J18DRAFT_441905 [Chaetomium sp. MPI-SDFR-AT-0129]